MNVCTVLTLMSTYKILFIEMWQLFGIISSALLGFTWLTTGQAGTSEMILLTCIWEMLSMNFGVRAQTQWGFLWFSAVPPSKLQGSTLKSGRYCLPSKFIPIRCSLSCRSVLCWQWWQTMKIMQNWLVCVDVGKLPLCCDCPWCSWAPLILLVQLPTHILLIFVLVAFESSFTKYLITHDSFSFLVTSTPSSS
jgi:hypothetical protein